VVAAPVVLAAAASVAAENCHPGHPGLAARRGPGEIERWREKPMTSASIHDRLLAMLGEVFPDTFPGQELGLDGLWAYVRARGSEPYALVYAQLFCPRFVEVDGSVLLDGPIKVSDDLAADFRDAKAVRGSVAKAEESINWIEVPYLFNDRSGPDEGSLLLGQFIAELWRARLNDLYAPRKFEAAALSPEETNDVVHVRFREIR
jgi:hypothetical protein